MNVNAVTFDTPVIAPEMAIEDPWIDEHGQLGNAGYTLLFDRIAEHAFGILSCGAHYRAQTGRAMLVAQAGLTHLRELRKADQVRGAFRLIDADDSRIQAYMELYHVEGWLSATSERVYQHADPATMQPVPFGEELASDLATMQRYHRALPPTKYMGRPVSLK